MLWDDGAVVAGSFAHWDAGADDVGASMDVSQSADQNMPPVAVEDKLIRYVPQTFTPPLMTFLFRVGYCI